MSSRFLGGTATALIVSFSSQAALADVTAQDVWSDWQEYLAASGYQVSGSEQMSGDTLTVSDITMTLPIPEEQMTFKMEMPSISLTENGDGTVNIGLPSPYPLAFSAKEGLETKLSGEIVLDHENTVIHVSGDPNNLTYTYSSDRTAMRVDNLTMEGKKTPPEAMKVEIALTGTSGVSKMSKGELRKVDQQFQAEALSYDIAFSDPESAGQGMLKGELKGLTGTALGSIPKDMDTTDMDALLKAGFDMGGSLAYSSGSGSMQGSGDGESFSIESSSDGGGFKFAMSANQLAYDITGLNTAINMTSDSLPFPVAIRAAETALNLAFPVSKSDTPQDFRFGLTLGGFTMSDMIWSMFDPGGALPHDPATVAVDLNGQATLDVDIMDPEQAAAMGGKPPGEVNALNIDTLLVSAVGAKLQGMGSFTFDNSAFRQYGAPPQPIGQIELQLDGANALIDKLIQMGFIQEQDAMGARMMMGMFAVPGDGPDSLKSKIEFNDQGHILANGQRIQ